MATVVWYFTHGHGIQCFFETHTLKMVSERWPCTRRGKTVKDRGGGLFWGDLSIVPHRWGRKAYILYFHLLITYRRSPSYQCQLNGKNKYVLQGTIHLHSSFLPICVNCKVQHAIVYGLAIKEKKWKRGWSEREKRTENCLSHPSLSLYVAYLLPVIGSFNVARGLRWWPNV